MGPDGGPGGVQRGPDGVQRGSRGGPDGVQMGSKRGSRLRGPCVVPNPFEIQEEP